MVPDRSNIDGSIYLWKLMRLQEKFADLRPAKYSITKFTEADMGSRSLPWQQKT